MHPLISRFLALDAAVAALEKTSGLDPDEAALAEAAQADLPSKKAVLSAKGRKIAPTEAQQAVLLLATRAATKRLEADPVLGPKLARAREALIAEGATADQARGLIAQAVFEEAFGGAEAPDAFDAEFLAETFDSYPALAKLDTDAVDEWLETFSKRGPQGERALRLAVAEAVLESAWSEGPQPVTTEHVDDALEGIAGSVAKTELEKAAGLLTAFLGFLAEKGLVGPERLARLTHLVQSAVAGGLDPDGDDDTDSGEDDDTES